MGPGGGAEIGGLIRVDAIFLAVEAQEAHGGLGVLRLGREGGDAAVPVFHVGHGPAPLGEVAQLRHHLVQVLLHEGAAGDEHHQGPACPVGHKALHGQEQLEVQFHALPPGIDHAAQKFDAQGVVRQLQLPAALRQGAVGGKLLGECLDGGQILLLHGGKSSLNRIDGIFILSLSAVFRNTFAQGNRAAGAGKKAAGRAFLRLT